MADFLPWNVKNVSSGGGAGTFSPTWFAYTGSSTGTSDDLLLDGTVGNRKLSGYLGGPGGGQPQMLSMSVGTLVTTYDASNDYQMVTAQSKWAAPTVGQSIFYSTALSVYCPGDMHSCHNWQLNNGSGSYLFFTHPLGNGGSTFNWDFEFPLQAYPSDRYRITLNQYPTVYFINIRITPSSSTVAKVAIQVYNSDGTPFADSSGFRNNNGDPLGTHNLQSDNPDLAIPSGDQAHYYGGFEMGNNSDSGIAASNFILNKYWSTHITATSTDWPGARVPT